ncbi:DCC-interacting protein 13-alpha-like [Lingula anatina]|uniref:DCC-interacting protein 13-alpha-like n=1 Tax=Lingula anatina TaxID=7574 RepID=A0A1S3JFF8_LINAN|nr:DCC-interacting protein 13-alpha-like [Lingula anatina]|eukprot:XP_013409150.2 DCC-interacting protein 13-alpha-like [Lingula anatina]
MRKNATFSKYPTDLQQILSEVDQMPTAYNINKSEDKLTITIVWKNDPRDQQLQNVNTVPQICSIKKKKSPSRLRRDQERMKKWQSKKKTSHQKQAVQANTCELQMGCNALIDNAPESVQAPEDVPEETLFPFHECDSVTDELDASAAVKTELKNLRAKLKELEIVRKELDATKEQVSKSNNIRKELDEKNAEIRRNSETIKGLKATLNLLFQTALHYFTALNAVQYKRKTALLDPFLGMLHAYRAFFHMGQDRFSKEDIDDFVSNISASVQGVHKELALETQKTIEQMDKLEIETSPRYHVEVPAGEDSRPVNTMLGQKSGYLCLRSKQNMLASSKWDAHYFFTQGGNLMSQNRNELAGSLVCDLNEEGLHVESTESDDRRYVFQVVAPASKKTIILQAENEVEKEEWIQTIKNIAKEGGYVKERDPSETNKKVGKTVQVCTISPF